MSGTETEEAYGSLLFFRKNGKPGTSYPLNSGKICIGHSTDADIRLKLKDERLEEIHCIIDVTEDGIATILNKSTTAPVRVNTNPIRKFKVLSNKDKIDLLGKQFQYLNDTLSKKDVEKHQAVLNNIISTPSKKRQSVAPIIKVQSTPNLKTKITVQKKQVSRKSLNSDKKLLSTPESNLNGSHIIQKSKTTSKLIVSKALGSPIRTKSRRLSWDNKPSKANKKPKVSARNILLSEKNTSNMSDDEEPVPSLFLSGDDSGDASSSSNHSGAEQTAAKGTPLSVKTPNKSPIKITVTEATPIKTPKSMTPLMKSGRTPKTTPLNSKLNLNENKKTPKNTPRKLSKPLSTPVTTESPKTKTPFHKLDTIGNKIKTPKDAKSSDLSKLSSTPVRIRTPKITPLKSKSNTVEKLKSVPKNKRLEVLKGTPTSTKKSTQTESPNTNNTQMGETPKSSNMETESSPALKRKTNNNVYETPSTQNITQVTKFETPGNIKKRTKSVECLVSPNASTHKRRKTEGNQPNDVIGRNTPKTIYKKLMPSSGRKSKLNSLDSGGVSEGSETLNLSADSLISPIQPRKTLCSTDSDVYEPPVLNDPRLSLGKASPRKSARKSQQINESAQDKDRDSSEGSNESVPEQKATSSFRNSLRHSALGNSLAERKEERGDSSDSSEEALKESYRDSFNKSGLRRSVKQDENNKSFSKSKLSLPKDSVTKNKQEPTKGQEESSDSSGSTFIEEKQENRLSGSRSSRQSRTSSLIEKRLQNSSSSETSLSEDNFNSSNRKQFLKQFEENSRLSNLQLSLKSNVQGQKEEGSSSEESNIASPLTRKHSMKRSLGRDSIGFLSQSSKKSQSFRRSNLKEKDGSDERTREESPSSEESDISDIKRVFVPQRRPSIKRSYVDQDKELLVCLSRSATPQIEDNSKVSDRNDSLDSFLKNEIICERRSSRKRSVHKCCTSCETSPISTPARHKSSFKKTSDVFNETGSSESDFLLPGDELKKYTPNSKKMSETQSEDEMEPLYISSNSKRSSRNKTSLNETPFNKSRRSSSVIMVEDDSIKSTPENNISIINLDTPLEKTKRVSQRKPSKTLNSSFEDDLELTTPKSAIKSRRSKSLPYEPIVEDITPVSLQETNGEEENGFKTPMNTPGLFENIKKSVLKSRSRRRPSNNLMEELSKAEVKEICKRPRESTGSGDRSAKKRKVLVDNTFDSPDEDLDASFASFASDEVFPEVSDRDTAPNTPEYFKNLTDKPVINDPQAKSLTDPRKPRSSHGRRSLHAMKFASRSSSGDRTSETNDTSFNSTDASFDSNDVVNESTESSRRLSRRLSLKAQREAQSPMSDVTNVPTRSPRNDLSDVRGVRRLLQTPKPVSSPKNDLRNIIGVKKLLATPKPLNSPKNDLTQVPNLRQLVYQENSPKNDLSNVAGIKKLLSTPKEVKSPKNDLRNVPNLRRVMSPKVQNSPRNDLSDVAGLKKLLSTPKIQNEPKNDLTNVAGVKKLLSTPVKQKSPKNDLSKVPNLRRVMYPKQENAPLNDLSDVEGVADIFAVHNTENDVENNGNLFDKLFDKKPIRTYRGRSLSPITRKAKLYGSDDRKTLGDSPCSSPLVKKWLEDQAIMRLERVSDGEVSDREDDRDKMDRISENKAVESPKIQLEFKSPLPAKRGRPRKASTKEDEMEQSSEVHSTTEDIPPVAAKRLRKRKASTSDEIESSDNEVTPVRTRKGRARTISRDKALDSTEKKPTRRGRKASTKDEVESKDEEVQQPVKRRGRPRTISRGESSDSTEKKPVTRRKAQNKEEDKSVDVEMSPLVRQRGRTRNISRDKTVDSTEDVLKDGKLKKDENDGVTEVESMPKRQGRPRSMSCDEVISVVKRGRGRKAQKVEDRSSDEIDPPKELVHKGRKAQKKDEEESSVAEIEPLPKHQGRPRSMSCDEAVGLIKRTRGRKPQKTEDKSSDEVDPQPKRRGRPRTVSCDEGNDSINRKTRGRKVQTKDDNENSETAENVKPVVSTEQKQTRGRRTAKQTVKDDGSDIVEAAPIPKRRGRAKKVLVDELKEEANEVGTPDTTPSQKQRGRRTAKTKQTEDVSKENPRVVLEQIKESTNTPIVAESSDESKDEDSASLKVETKKKREPAKRGGRRKAVEETPEITDEEPAEKKNQPKKKNQKSSLSPQVVEKPARKGGRRKVAVKETNESLNEDDKENLEEQIPQTKTRAKKEPAKKKILVEEEVPDSPRTRQRKGDFKKYGSEFETEIEKGKVGKSVHFEDAEEDSSGKRGRRGKVAEEIEETVRRSKRTRK